MNVEVGVVKVRIKGVIDHRDIAEHSASLVIESITYNVEMSGSVGGVIWFCNIFRF